MKLQIICALSYNALFLSTTVRQCCHFEVIDVCWVRSSEVSVNVFHLRATARVGLWNKCDKHALWIPYKKFSWMN